LGERFIKEKSLFFLSNNRFLTQKLAQKSLRFSGSSQVRKMAEKSKDSNQRFGQSRF
jgi:hypothetical protein